MASEKSNTMYPAKLHLQMAGHSHDPELNIDASKFNKERFAELQSELLSVTGLDPFAGSGGHPRNAMFGHLRGHPTTKCREVLSEEIKDGNRV